MALYNSNADEIFTLQSLHNQGIGSSGGGGGDIGNFISIGRDESSFPGFFSIAAGDGAIAAGEGSVATGDSNITIAQYGGLTNGFKNTLVVGGTYGGGGAIFGRNNISLSSSYGGVLIAGDGNVALPKAIANPVIGTNIFIGYWDNNSKLLYSDKEMTQLIEYTVPEGGCFIIDYKPTVIHADNREESQPRIYFTNDGINYPEFTDKCYTYGLLVNGYNNRIFGAPTYGSTVLGNQNTIRSEESATTTTAYRYGIDQFFVFGEANNLYTKDSNNGMPNAVIGKSNKITRLINSFIEGSGNIVGTNNQLSGGYIIMGRDNRANTHSNVAYNMNAVFIGESNNACGGNGPVNIPDQYFWGAYAFGRSNSFCRGNTNHLIGNGNLLGSKYTSPVSLVKINDEYYTQTITYDENLRDWKTVTSDTPITNFSTYSIYFYNNKYYKSLDGTTLTLIDTRRYCGSIGSIYDAVYESYILGENNTAYGATGVSILGRGNALYQGQSVTVGEDNKTYFDYYTGSLTSGFRNITMGRNRVIGNKNIVNGYDICVLGDSNTTALSSDPVNRRCVKGLRSGVQSEIKKFCPTEGKFYQSSQDNNIDLSYDFKEPQSFQTLISDTSKLYQDGYNSPYYYKYNADNNRYEVCFDPDYVELETDRPVTTTILGFNNTVLNGTANIISGLNNYINDPNMVASHIAGESIYISSNNYIRAAHAEGYETTIGASYAHTEGYKTIAAAECSSASGRETIALGVDQTVIGRYNTSNNNAAFVIGGGTDSSNRANILTLDWNGNLSIAGNFSFNVPTPVNPGDIMTKGVTDGYITDEYNEQFTYWAGDYCIHNNTLYFCRTDIETPEPWTPSHWMATTIADEIGYKQDVMDNNLTTTNKNIVGAINEINAKLPWTDFDNVLTAGATTVTVTDAAITATSAIDVYTNVWGVEPTNMVLATGSVTLTFEAQASDINVKVRVS